MAIISTKTDSHWNYFLSIEQDLDRLSRFVEFDEQNYCCYSVEIARLLIAAAAEAEVVCKQICKNSNPTTVAENIHHFRNEITIVHPIISCFEVCAPRFGLRLKPWDNWSQINGVPEWWTAYNKIKHHRDSEFSRANLKNVLNAVAGLFIACLYLYKEKAEEGLLLPSPAILRPCDDRFGGLTHGDFEFGINYNLD